MSEKNITLKELIKSIDFRLTHIEDIGADNRKLIVKLIKQQSIIIVCGPGNNGGDGFVIAEYLRKKKFDIKVFCLKKKYYQGDALKALKKLKMKAKGISDFQIKNESIIVDCLFGTGLSRNISGFWKDIIYKINKSKQKIISIDMPSGIHGDSGKIMNCAVKASMTLVLHARKAGHTFYPGKKYCGKIIVVDIGISRNFN